MGLFDVFKNVWEEREYDCHMKCDSCGKMREHHVVHQSYPSGNYKTVRCKYCGKSNQFKIS